MRIFLSLSLESHASVKLVAFTPSQTHLPHLDTDTMQSSAITGRSSMMGLAWDWPDRLGAH